MPEHVPQVLILAKDERALASLRSHAHGHGCRPHIAGQLEAARSAIDETRFDAVLVDLTSFDSPLDRVLRFLSTVGELASRPLIVVFLELRPDEAEWADLRRAADVVLRMPSNFAEMGRLLIQHVCWPLQRMVIAGPGGERE